MSLPGIELIGSFSFKQHPVTAEISGVSHQMRLRQMFKKEKYILLILALTMSLLLAQCIIFKKAFWLRWKDVVSRY